MIPPAAITGQAAGIAVAHAIDESCAVCDVRIGILQRALEERGVLIHFDDADVPETVSDVHEYND